MGAGAALEGSALFGLVPRPQKLEQRAGSPVRLSRHARVVADPLFANEAAVLDQWLRQAWGLRKPQEQPSDQTPLNEVRLVVDPQLTAREAYTLCISHQGIELSSSQPEGMCRAAATLWQLVLSQGYGLPPMRISDYARFAWRGLMLDCARNFYSVDFLLRLLDLAALHKLNVFHWHLTDDQGWRVAIPGMAELTAKGAYWPHRNMASAGYRDGFYTLADLKRVVDYAAARHIEVLPEIDVPGHSSALLASHPELWCHADYADRTFAPQRNFGIFDAVLCPGKEASYALLDQVFQQLSKIFPFPFLHTGGDEVPKNHWLTCADCRQTMRCHQLRDADGAFDAERLQAYFCQRMAELVEQQGKTMVAWDEVVDGHCAKDVQIMAWRSAENGHRAAAKGHQVVMCPHNQGCYLNYQHLNDPEEPGNLGLCSVGDSYAFDPAPSWLTAEQQQQIVGGQANLWSELLTFGRQVEYMLFPRLCALAESLWCPPDLKNFADFTGRLHIHGQRLDLLGVQRYRGPLTAEK